ncbi:MAG: hypothetical protein EZS28_050063, partial [Streblomastix strix]
MVYEASRESKL